MDAILPDCYIFYQAMFTNPLWHQDEMSSQVFHVLLDLNRATLIILLSSERSY